jgi:hypothetical protein
MTRVDAGVLGVLLLVLCVAGLVLGFRKLFSDPEARKIAKILLVLPLMVVGSLLLAFVVLMATYRFSEIGARPATAVRANDDVKSADAVVSSDAASIGAQRAAVSQPRPASGGADSREGARFFLAVNRAFVGAMRSTFAKGPRTEASTRSELVSRPAASPAMATARSSKLEPAAAPTPPGAATTPAKRPPWIDNPPQSSADAYEMAVKAGPWKTPVECEQSLDEEIEWAVDSYVAWRIGDEAREQVVLPVDYARKHLVKDQWLEKINTSLGEMYNLHALLSFDRQVEGKLRDMWTGIVTAARLVLAAAVLGGGLLLLSVIYGYLKIDLATGGAYRGRLRLAVVAILALAAAGAAFSTRLSAFSPKSPGDVVSKS